MILEVFSLHTGERVDMIRTYSMVSYTVDFCGSGSFSLTVPYTESSLKVLNKEHCILFEEGALGIIRYRKKSTTKLTTIEIKGYMISKILDWRSFLKTKTLKGSITEICRASVNELMINNIDPRRNFEIVTLSDDLEYQPYAPSVSTQMTGKKLSTAVQSLLGSIGYGYSLFPVVSAYYEKSDNPTNISALEFRIHKPVDHSIDNTEGNTPVVFSIDMNNLSSFTLIEDDTEMCTTAIVAGEGEGTERVIVETGDKIAYGFNRIELYVDARDIQSDSEESTMTPEEYEEALIERGESYLQDHLSFTSVDGSVIDGASQYKYGVDFKNGDYVSIVDNDLGITIAVQITSVTKSNSRSGEHLDITFGYERSTIQKIIRKRGIA